jgi:replicative DNA helicase
MSDKSIIQDISVESMVVGMLFRKPELFNEYIELIFPEYDFSENGLRFLYNVLVDTFLSSNILNETSINITISRMDELSQKLYKDMGGFKLFQRLSTISEVSDDFKKYYEQLKSYNVLRHLESKGFSVNKHLDKLKGRTVEQIIKTYELQLVKASSYIKGINDSVILGDNILELYNNLKENPSVGIQLPFPILNQLVRGWIECGFYASALHSGFGKSRMIVFMLTYMSVVNQVPILFIINEQERVEVELMLLTCVANNVFSSKYGMLVDETEIATGKCTGKKEEMVIEAAKFIQERSKIHFMETNDWGYDSLKMILKKHRLKGIKYAIIDTFKSMRGAELNGMPDYMQFAYTAERLKSIIGSEAKGGLNMGLWVTMQLTDESLLTKVLGSSSIANSKQIKHSLDVLLMGRLLDARDKESIEVEIKIPNNPFNGQRQKLENNKTHYMVFLDKNRKGADKVNLVYEVDKGKMIWKELGHAVFTSN